VVRPEGVFVDVSGVLMEVTHRHAVLSQVLRCRLYQSGRSDPARPRAHEHRALHGSGRRRELR
jgi:hypothetical protein